MKRIVRSVTMMGMLLGVVGTTTAWGEILRTVIPFEFQVDGKTLPAGKYELAVDAATHRATLRTEGGAQVYLPAHPTQWKEHQEIAAVAFHRYGNVHYLRSWKMAGTFDGYQAPESRGEKAAMKGGGAREVAMLLVKPAR
jgi:hypothetical protein